jgi:hypothetical protein
MYGNNELAGRSWANTFIATSTIEAQVLKGELLLQLLNASSGV